MGGKAKTCAASALALVLGTGLLFGLRSAGAEEEIPVKNLPKAVVAAVKALYPNGTITEAEKDTEDGKVVYEIEVTSGGKEIDIELTADGKVLKIESDDGDEEGEEDEDDAEDEDEDDDDDDDEDEDEDEDDDDDDDDDDDEDEDD